MNKKVTLRELLASRIVVAICIAVYYWCWARNDWQNYYTAIQTGIAAFTFFFLWSLYVREKKYRKESMDELAITNLRRCDSICLKITMVFIVCIGFLSAVLRFAVSSEIIGYMLMAVLVGISIIRTVLFCVMDAKGV